LGAFRFFFKNALVRALRGMLQSRPPDRAWEGVNHLFLWRNKLIEPPTEFSLISVRRQTSHRTWGPHPLGLPLTSLCDLPLLFVYFQVNNDVLYFLDYVQDIYIMG
ncbi:unnamed protein product, partial [Ascophyllum nodosum]